MVSLTPAFQGKRVWLSGHTGFKGAWLSEILISIGAVVHGYALAPNTVPSLFDQLDLVGRLENEVADIRSANSVKCSIHSLRPDFVIHMAAQPLVRRSYAFPVETYETNVIGTINVLEALRGIRHPCTALIVTTDKCYENLESGRAYEESDPLGGYDPYSSSKAMAEIVTAAYRKSYFQNGPVRIASARAGNVIGGGDWSEDRIVPDAMRALDRGQTIDVRNPKAVRPWQHVLEPISGYLTLIARLAEDPTVALPFNFGHGSDSNRTVEDLVAELLKYRQGYWRDASDPKAPHEARLLCLSIARSKAILNWRPKWSFAQTVEKTAVWYRDVREKKVTPLEITRRQIMEYNK